MNKLKNMPLFYKIYFSLIILFIIALGIFSAWLVSFIDEYNEGIPETVSKRFFEETFINSDTQRIIEMSGVTHSEFETDRDLMEYIENGFSSPLSFTSVSSSDEQDSKRYIVKSGEYKCAAFTLTPDKNGDYHPDTLELYLSGKISKTYKVYGSAKLKLNGIEVDESYITATEPYKYSHILPQDCDAPQWKIYEISGLTKEPLVSLTDRNGNEALLSESDGILTESIIYDEPDEELKERLITAAKEYAKCMQNDAPKSAVYPYIEKGTELYNSIRLVETGFVWDHSGYDFEDISFTEFMRYDDNTVSARISFTHVLKMNGRPDYRDITDITYFARNIDGEYMIFAMQNE